MTLQDFQRLLHPYWVRIANMVSIGELMTVDDDNADQLLQVELAGGVGEVRDEQHRVQSYGLTSRPLPGATILEVFVGGKRDSGYVVQVDDPRHRPTGLQAGEVCVYSNTGSRILLKANGDIELTPHSGKVKVNGDLEATGDVKAGTISLQSHKHIMDVAHSPIAVSGTTGTISGTSGDPS